MRQPRAQQQATVRERAGGAGAPSGGAGAQAAGRSASGGRDGGGDAGSAGAVVDGYRAAKQAADRAVRSDDDGDGGGPTGASPNQG